MNKNIEVINEHLWLVNFKHLDQGYISELKHMSQNHTDYRILTKEGILILDKAYEEGKDVATLFNFVMKLDDEQLQEGQSFKSYLVEKNPKMKDWDEKLMNTYVGYHCLENLLHVFNNISEMEKVRRKVEKEYKRKNRFKFLKRR
ncbi:hypothetical protein LMF32_11970 [Desemzia sp. C1]|uniref:hypothetical protein n=1 Tax=Desemzia sp. C1 TaxID=2892016 RepID=UPI001E37B5F7|nr:hypothetical protein [Desemzia sp. C1]MCI3029761.1 hypothetical protein [Desemzia sp. C1]